MTMIPGQAPANPMRWFRVRRAHIPNDEREILQRFDPSVIGTVLAGGFTASAEDLQPLHADKQRNRHAAEWLTEQHDKAERWETWSLTMEIAITFLVFFELVFSVLDFLRVDVRVLFPR